LEASARRDLAYRIGPAALRRLSIQLHVHQDPTNTAEAVKPVDPLLEEVAPRAARPASYTIFKGAVDRLGGLTLLTVLSPLFLLIGVLIKLTSTGPVFFRQVRVGHRTKPFTILKFRTMRVDASHAIHNELVTSFTKSGEQVRQPGHEGPFKRATDPR